MASRTALEATAPPSFVRMPLEKKYFSSYVPRGVCTYFPRVTRLTVDSCIPTSSAICCSVRGLSAETPLSKKPRCARRMLSVTRTIVRRRFSMLCTIHRAALSFLEMNSLSSEAAPDERVLR